MFARPRNRLRGPVLKSAALARVVPFDLVARVALAEIEIFAQIMNDRNGKVVEAKLFQASVPVAEDTAPAAVNGLNAALDEVLQQLVTWAVPRL